MRSLLITILLFVRSIPFLQKVLTMIPQAVTDALNEFAAADDVYDGSLVTLGNANASLTEAQQVVSESEIAVSEARITKSAKRAALEDAINDAFGV